MWRLGTFTMIHHHKMQEPAHHVPLAETKLWLVSWTAEIGVAQQKQRSPKGTVGHARAAHQNVAKVGR